MNTSFTPARGTAAVPTISRTRSATMSGTVAGATTRVATLVLQAPHEPGIVTALSRMLGGRGATTLDSAHFSDASTGTYFQRVQLDLHTLAVDRAALEADLSDLAVRHGLRWRLWYGDRKRRLAIFASKEDHCLYDLLIRHRNGELPCEVAMVLSNHPDAGKIAAHFNIPFHHLPVTAITKPEQEAQAAALIDGASVDLIVLARYMQILSPTFVARYPGQIINVHHSFLPAFIGASPYRQAHEKGVKMIGATSHYVTADLDQGPIIEQTTVRCGHRDSVADLVRKGREAEKHVLAAAVRWHLEDRVLVDRGKTVVFE